MSKHRRAKLERRTFVDLQNRANLVFRSTGYDPQAHLDPDMADEWVRELRRLGVVMWLHPEPDGTVRTRMAMPPITAMQESRLKELAQFLTAYARDLAKAIARTGDFNPPPDNAWGDQPLPPGGQWDWGDS